MNVFEKNLRASLEKVDRSNAETRRSLYKLAHKRMLLAAEKIESPVERSASVEKWMAMLDDARRSIEADFIPMASSHNEFQKLNTFIAFAKNHFGVLTSAAVVVTTFAEFLKPLGDYTEIILSIGIVGIVASIGLRLFSRRPNFIKLATATAVASIFLATASAAMLAGRSIYPGSEIKGLVVSAIPSLEIVQSELIEIRKAVEKIATETSSLEQAKKTIEDAGYELSVAGLYDSLRTTGTTTLSWAFSEVGIFPTRKDIESWIRGSIDKNSEIEVYIEYIKSYGNRELKIYMNRMFNEVSQFFEAEEDMDKIYDEICELRSRENIYLVYLIEKCYSNYDFFKAVRRMSEINEMYFGHEYPKVPFFTKRYDRALDIGGFKDLRDGVYKYVGYFQSDYNEITLTDAHYSKNVKIPMLLDSSNVKESNCFGQRRVYCRGAITFTFSEGRYYTRSVEGEDTGVAIETIKRGAWQIGINDSLDHLDASEVVSGYMPQNGHEVVMFTCFTSDKRHYPMGMMFSDAAIEGVVLQHYRKFPSTRDMEIKELVLEYGTTGTGVKGPGRADREYKYYVLTEQVVRAFEKYGTISITIGKNKFDFKTSMLLEGIRGVQEYSECAKEPF